jgi:hypothetical protein
MIVNDKGEEPAVCAVGVVGNSEIDVLLTGSCGAFHCHVFVESDVLRLEWQTDEHEEMKRLREARSEDLAERAPRRGKLTLHRKGIVSSTPDRVEACSEPGTFDGGVVERLPQRAISRHRNRHVERHGEAISLALRALRGRRYGLGILCRPQWPRQTL